MAYVELAQGELSPEDQAVLTEFASSGALPPGARCRRAVLTIISRRFQCPRNSAPEQVVQTRPNPLRCADPVQVDWTSGKSIPWSFKNEAVGIVKTAQLETTKLMSNMLLAASKQHGDKLKKYIQSGDEKDLGRGVVLNIVSLQSLLKLTEGLLKITGQDRQSKVKVSTTNTQNVNVNVTGAGDLTPDDAAKILEIMSAAKRKKSDAT